MIYNDITGVVAMHEYNSTLTEELNELDIEMVQIFDKIDKIDSCLFFDEPGYIYELQECEIMQTNDEQEGRRKRAKWKDLFKKEEPFDLNSGESIESRMIVSFDFGLFNRHGEDMKDSPTFGEIVEDVESYVSEYKWSSEFVKYKYQLLSLKGNRKLELKTPQFAEMGRSTFSHIFDCFRKRVV